MGPLSLLSPVSDSRSNRAHFFWSSLRALLPPSIVEGCLRVNACLRTRETPLGLLSFSFYHTNADSECLHLLRIKSSYFRPLRTHILLWFKGMHSRVPCHLFRSNARVSQFHNNATIFRQRLCCMELFQNSWKPNQLSPPPSFSNNTDPETVALRLSASSAHITFSASSI